MGGESSTRLENHIETYARMAEHEIKGALERVAKDAADVAKATLGTSGHGDDSIHRGIKPLPVEHLGGVWQTGVGAGDWKSNFFEKGTHAHSVASKSRRVYQLTKKGNRRRRRVAAVGGGPYVSGVEAYHYLRKGITVSSASLRAVIGAAFARIKV